MIALLWPGLKRADVDLTLMHAVFMILLEISYCQTESQAQQLGWYELLVELWRACHLSTGCLGSNTPRTYIMCYKCNDPHNTTPTLSSYQHNHPNVQGLPLPPSPSLRLPLSSPPSPPMILSHWRARHPPRGAQPTTSKSKRVKNGAVFLSVFFFLWITGLLQLAFNY